MAEFFHCLFTWFGLLSIPVSIVTIYVFFYNESLNMQKVWALGLSISAGIILFWHQDLVEIQIGDARARMKESADQVEEVGKKAILEIEKSLEAVDQKLTAQARITEASFTKTQRVFENVSDAVDYTMRKFEESLSKMENEMAAIGERTHSANLLVDLLRISIRASTNSRGDLEELKRIASNERHPHHDHAQAIFDSIIERDFPISIIRNHGPLDWVVPEKWMDLVPGKLFEIIREEQSGNRRLDVLLFVSMRGDWSKKEKLEYYASILSHDPNVSVIEAAGAFFNEEAKLPFRPLQYESILEWWERNKDTISQ